MTAQFSTPMPPAAEASAADADPLTTAADPLEFAREHVATAALNDTGDVATSDRLVGLELEYHLVDLSAPGRRPSWDEVTRLVSGLPAMPSGSSVTLEPGGQIELSTPPNVGVAASVEALQTDQRTLRAGLAAAGFGAAALGSDLARAGERINPSARYVAMEQHFRALGCAVPGRAMMTSTAALQLNLDAGPAARWSERLGRIRDLGPMLVAISACSPVMAGHASGWRSMRQQVWHGIDRRRTAAVPGHDPRASWAAYALDAPVMLIDEGHSMVAVTERVPFGAWVQGRAPFDRPPTIADLDFHLTTLFPPIRPRGYIELRCLDAMPDRWWPALAALTVALVDDDIAADGAAELCEPVRDRWVTAAHAGLDDPAVRACATGCLDLAARHCAPELKSDVEAYAELVSAGRTPGDEIREHIRDTDPLTVLEEESR